MPVATKAQEVAALASRIQNPRRREVALVRLRELYPGWVFNWDRGLSIYVSESVRVVPSALMHIASYVAREMLVGGYEVLKDRDGYDGEVIKGTPRTCFERVLGDDEF